MPIRFLNIDLDFFLDRIAHLPEGGRLSNRAYKPWSKAQVREFLEVRCGLSPKSKLPGRFVTNHDAAFDYWEELKRLDPTALPMKLVHVDAHADLGLGDASWVHIMTDVLHRPLMDRAKAERGPHKLSLGSYITYAVACRWIDSIEYVHPPKGGNDLTPLHFKDFDIKSGYLQLKCYKPEDVNAGGVIAGIASLKNCHPISLEPPVSFAMIRGDEWTSSAPFNRVLLCQSPDYTPRSSDNLISVFSDYIDFH
jgi:hypothetical protein